MKYRVYFCVLVAVLPLILLRDVTPDNELRYLSIADEALRNGTFFAFTNHGLPYADKPPLYLWLLMAAKWIFGRHSMLVMTMFSLIPAFLVTGLMSRWVSREVDEKQQPLGQLMMLTCGLFIGTAVFLRMDMLMTLFVLLAVYTFYKMMKGYGNYTVNRILFPLYLFLAIFTKGPVGILLPLVGTIAFLLLKKQGKTIGRYWGWSTWLILIVLCGAWFAMVYAEGGKAYLDNLLFHQTVDRAVNSFHHKRPFYYYFVTYWYMFAPWSLWLVYVVVAALRRKVVLSDVQRLFLTMVVTSFIALSLISSKLDIYFLPVFPYLLYLGFTLLGNTRWTALGKLTLALPAAVFALALPALAVCYYLKVAYTDNVWVLAGGALLTAGGVTALYLIYKRGQMERAIGSMAVGMLACVFVAGFSLPSINYLLGYGEACKVAREEARTAGLDEYYTFGVKRSENMDFYLGREVNIVPTDSAEVLTGKQGVLIFRTSRRKLLPPALHSMPTIEKGPLSVTVMK